MKKEKEQLFKKVCEKKRRNENNKKRI